MKQATLFIALLGAILLVGCGGNGDTTSQTHFNNGTGDQPFKPITHLSHRALVTNYYAGQLQVVDTTQDRLTSFTFASGTQPTFMQPSPDGTLTLINNSGANTITSLNNNLEAVKGTVNLGGWTESFVTSSDNKFGFAAVYNYNNGNPPNLPGAIVRFNPTDGSLNTQLPFPNVRYLAYDFSQTHLMAFTDVEDSPHWVDLTKEDVNQLPQLAVLSLADANGNPVLLSRPVSAFFTADNKAYILSCGTECGGTSGPSVTEIDVSTLTYSTTTHTGTAKAVKQWAVPGARRGLVDLLGAKLYVAGTNTTVDSGGNTVQTTNLTIIDTFAQTVSSPVKIGNGSVQLIRNINGVLWIGSSNCGPQSCITMVNLTTNAASSLANTNGDGTGISLSVNKGEVYTIEGGELFIYDQKGNPISSQYNTDIKGQAKDVLYID